jgi:hypothetical protein
MATLQPAQIEPQTKYETWRGLPKLNCTRFNLFMVYSATVTPLSSPAKSIYHIMEGKKKKE